MSTILGLISRCGSKLKHWNKTSFGNIQKQLIVANKKLEEAHNRYPQDIVQMEVNEVRKEVHLWLEMDELTWKKRSRTLWLNEGDRNSRFFHVNASNKRKRNSLVSLKIGAWEWVKKERLETHIIHYFQTMFMAKSEKGSMDFLDDLEGRVTESMQYDLSKDFTAEEVHVALKQMHPSKVPNLNGMPPLFYQKYWHIFGPKTTRAVLEALNSGQFPLTLNHTFITLIP